MYFYIDGRHFRIRRGKLTPIPEKWFRAITTKKTIRQRTSKLLHKYRKRVKYLRGREYQERNMPPLPSKPSLYDLSIVKEG